MKIDDSQFKIRKAKEREKEKRQKYVDQINDLVAQAFGRGWRGDYYAAHESESLLPMLLREQHPELIGKSFFRFPVHIAGKLSPDGSEITLSERQLTSYRSKIETYSSLYKQEFGSEVKVNLV